MIVIITCIYYQAMLEYVWWKSVYNKNQGSATMRIIKTFSAKKHIK